MVESADTAVSKAAARKGVRVRVPLPAPLSTAPSPQGDPRRPLRDAGPCRRTSGPRSRSTPPCCCLTRAYRTCLLGLYLGDGHIVRHPRGVYLISNVQDSRYPGLIEEYRDLLRAVKPGSRPHLRAKPGCTAIEAYSAHWPCLFPQHGPGLKHDRPIVLADWQRELVALDPRPFLRGLFHSDGCRVTNWTVRTVAGAPKRYEYPRYFFSNRSDDIRGLCTWALDLGGVPWTQPSRWNVSVARRAGVLALDEFVGPKY